MECHISCYAVLQFSASRGPTKDESIVIKDTVREKSAGGDAMRSASSENNIECVEIVIQYTVTVGFLLRTTQCKHLRNEAIGVN